MSFNRNLSFLAQGVSSTGVLNASYGGSLALQAVQAGNFTAVAGNAYLVNTTSGAITVTLPASPVAGNIVQITDYAGTFQTNNCTVNPNGLKINSSADNITLKGSRESVSFIYTDSTQGWVAYSGFLQSPIIYPISYLVVAGGGGAGYGGGGAGGYQTSTIYLNIGTTYSVTVGAGGTTANFSGRGGSGSNSVFGSVTSSGGGGAGAYSATLQNGLSGGSGGGAGSLNSSPFTTGSPGSGTSGQGNNGGNASANAAGGGGGASAVGGNAVTTTGGSGGAGSASSITGSSVTYAGGGGGAADVTRGSGGAGGGGNGGAAGAAGSSGTANTGGGGGGTSGSLNNGGAGGSGVVILSVPTVNYTGVTTGSPTITTSGSNTIIKFTASGSYTA